MIWKDEAILEPRPNGVLNHQLPHHRTKFSLEVLRCVSVLLRGRDMQDSANADQNALSPRVLDEGNLLCIKEAKRTFWLDMPGEAIKQRLLVSSILHPLFSKRTEIRFTLLLHI